MSMSGLSYMIRDLLPHDVVSVGVVVTPVHVVRHLEQLGVLLVGVGVEAGHPGYPEVQSQVRIQVT